MQVILQATVANLGKVGDRVNVKNGYARNFLIPYGKAVPATADAIAEFEKRRAQLEAKELAILQEAQKRAEKLNAITLTITAQASDEGKLFGSVGTRDVAEAATTAGVEIHKSEVNLPTGPIRQAGEYEIHLKLHSDVTAVVKLVVVAETAAK